MAKKVDGGYRNIITYAVSPMRFVLKNLPRHVEPAKSKHTGEYSTIGNVIPPEEIMQQTPNVFSPANKGGQTPPTKQSRNTPGIKETK